MAWSTDPSPGPRSAGSNEGIATAAPATKALTTAQRLRLTDVPAAAKHCVLDRETKHTKYGHSTLGHAQRSNLRADFVCVGAAIKHTNSV